MDRDTNAILEGLNAEQKSAVSCVEGPVLIVAGAGSGKTRVLTSRIAYILQNGCEPDRILALTFTKKAASEMKERIAVMVGQKKARHLVMGTFHSVFIRFLREYAQSLGYPEGFTIYDTSDSTSAIKACIKELQLDDKIYKPKDVLSRISMAKNNLVTVTAYRANQNLMLQDLHAKKPKMWDLYDLYQKKMKLSGVMDFDDILVNMNILLRDNQEALASISARFSHILVDEYQDTNFAQYLILRKLAQPHHNICVVGDDSQSIYAFRGAKIENILNFKKDYPESRTFRLERNYRSTPTIVSAANSVIAKNEGRIPKECYAVGDKGEKIHILRNYTEQEEATSICSEILDRMRTDKAQYQDFAILYRTNSQSRALEEALRRRNLPYMIYSGNSFFERAEVKDMMAWFKLVCNPYDDESFKRAVAKPSRGIGDTTMQALEAAARANATALFKAAYLNDLENYGLKAAAVTKVRAFCDLVNGFAMKVPSTDAHELATEISDKSGLYAMYKADTSIEGQARTANVEELVSSVQAFIEETQAALAEEGEDYNEAAMKVTLDQFLENVSLLSNVDVSEDEDTNNKIALMTVHSSKGLEFPYVFIAGLEENLFPSGGILASKADVEEERRLFYVAVTRAKIAVALSFASTRMRNGKHESNMPSRFVKEIDPQYIDNPLTDEDFQKEEAAPAFGPRFGSGFGSGARYGGSSEVKFIKRQPAQYGSRPQPASRPLQQRPSAPAAAVKPQLIDPDFVAVPMEQLFEGERVEHNRFGAGVIKEITGNAPELKAKIVFDAYGEKLLLLKYAKLRPFKG